MHDVDPRVLPHVRDEMGRLGAPRIRVMETDQRRVYAAIEGTHRLAVAAELGLRPRIDLIRAEPDQDIDLGEVLPSGKPIIRPFGWLRATFLEDIRSGMTAATYRLDAAGFRQIPDVDAG